MTTAAKFLPMRLRRSFNAEACPGSTPTTRASNPMADSSLPASTAFTPEMTTGVLWPPSVAGPIAGIHELPANCLNGVSGRADGRGIGGVQVDVPARPRPERGDGAGNGSSRASGDRREHPIRSIEGLCEICRRYDSEFLRERGRATPPLRIVHTTRPKAEDVSPGGRRAQDSAEGLGELAGSKKRYAH